MRHRATLALLGVLALLPAVAAAEPKDPPAKGKPPAAGKGAKLPAGCERITDGRDFALSPDGKRLAYSRWKPSGKQDYHSIDIEEARIVVRDLATKKEKNVPSALGPPVGWTTTGGLALASGTVVDAVTGKPVPGTAALPEGAKFCALAWSPDGKRLLYVPDVRADTPMPKPGELEVPILVEADGSKKPLDFGDKVYAEEQGAVAWSADGKRIAFNLGYFHMGQVPPRCMGVFTLEPLGNEVFAEMPLSNGIPGLHEERRPMRPLPGTTGPRIGTCVWDATGGHFVYVFGTGDGNADLYVGAGSGTKRWRQTTDGATKWSPALDAAGRRVAFLTGKVVDWPAGIEGRKLRVLDLLTAEAKDYELPGAAGLPGNVAWSPDGQHVFYEIHGGDTEGVFSQTVPAAAAAPDGATIQDLVVGLNDEQLAALRSDQPNRAEEAVRALDARWSAKLEAPVREALLRWMDAANYGPATAILRMFADHKVIAATPEARKALASKQTLVVNAAIAALVAFGAKDAIPDLDVVRTKHADRERKVQAAGAMVALGDERGWADLKAAASDKEADVKDTLCSALGRLRDVRSVELLLPLVGDDGFLYTTHGGDHVVGDHAAQALARLTGQFFRRDRARWAAWWKDEAKGALPADVDASTALAAYESWMEEREEEHQRKMREQLKKFGLPQK